MVGAGVGVAFAAVENSLLSVMIFVFKAISTEISLYLSDVNVIFVNLLSRTGINTRI